MDPVSVAVRGKGLRGLAKRVAVISRHYGLTPRKMERTMDRFVAILRAYGARATFPVTSVVLTRQNGSWDRYVSPNVEFAVHGYYHVDHTLLDPETQIGQLTTAQQVFRAKAIGGEGIRLPYLRWNEDTIAAVREAGFLYDGTPSIAWDVVDGQATEDYAHVLAFYESMSASAYPALPRLRDGIVRIPYCLPDDEALVDRLHLATPEPMSAMWQAVLAETHRLGELFTLGLHPERLPLCEVALIHTLSRAQALRPAVWMARLDEIARWWKARLDARVAATPLGEGRYEIAVDGPPGVTLLARNVQVLGASQPWDDRYSLVSGARVRVQAARRPWIGLSPGAPPALASFLQQQGYIVEVGAEPGDYSLYLDTGTFTAENERPLLERIEAGRSPLVRLGRWPDGAKSALCITGDVDAITIFDYALRFVGR